MNPANIGPLAGALPPEILRHFSSLSQPGLGQELLLSPQPAEESDFKSLIMQSIGQVNQMQQDADLAIESLMTGGDINPAEVLTAIQKADMSFRMMQQIRNKLMDAYREIKEIRI